MGIEENRELQIGKAGEYLVCCDLIMKGFYAFPSEQSLPYDILLDVGNKLYRVQVKTTWQPRLLAKSTQRTHKFYVYVFEAKGQRKGTNLTYHSNDVDIFALVALDSKTIGYMWSKDMPSIKYFRSDLLRGTYPDEVTLFSKPSTMPYLSSIYRSHEWFSNEVSVE